MRRCSTTALIIKLKFFEFYILALRDFVGLDSHFRHLRLPNGRAIRHARKNRGDVRIVGFDF